jgi:hypothetical protein
MQAEQDRLTRLMKVGTGASAAQIQSLNSQANALENLGVVTKGNITQVQSQLATFNLQASTISKLTPAILDYVTAEKGATASTEQFKSMTNGLAQALNGNFTSLTRVGFVIDQTTRDLIKNGTEAERVAAIVQVLDSTYKGFNASLRDTPIGQMQLLAASADNAREVIGEGLIDAMALLGGQGTKDIEKATNMMDALARATADVIRGEAVILSNLGSLGGGTVGKIGGGILQYFKEVTGIQARQDLGRATRPRNTAGRFFGGGSQGTLFDKDAALAARREKERLALAKKQLDSQKKLTAEQKKQAALKKAGTVFDLDQIQIIAALKGRVSDEDRKRLELQFALLTGNEKEASRLTYQIAIAQGLGERLASFLASLPDAKNPFASWEAYLDMLMEKARKLGTVTSSSTAATATASSQAAAAAAVISAPSFVGTPFGQAGSAAATALGTPFGQAGSAPSTNVVPFVGTPFGQAGGNGSGFIGTPFGQSIELKITGEGDITNAIAKGLQNQSLSTGTTTTINRSGGFL